MRGKVVTPEVTVKTEGITPAHAGKSIFDITKRNLCRDHPRACGEKRGIKRKVVDEMGSPPRMRGKD